MTTRTLDLANVISSDATFTGDKTFSGDITFSGDVVPSSPLSHRNLIINGAMQVSQRGTSFTTGSGYGDYTLDRFTSAHAQTGKFTINQVEDGPTGFKNSLKITSSSAYTVGASEDFLIRHKIEGTNCIPLEQGTSNAKSVTLSFYVKSSLTGTFAVSFQNSANNRHYIATYTISSANTWERKTISLTLDTSGTWLTTTGIGLIIAFSLGVGSNLDGTAGAWAAGNKLSTSGSVDLVSTNGATWFLTGVQLELGDNATPFENRTLQDELLRCQRYFYMVGGDAGGDPEGASGNQRNYIVGRTSNSNAMYCAPPSAVPMRSTPTVGNFSGSFNINCINKDGATNLNTQPTIDTYNYGKPGNTVGNMYLSGGSGLTDGRVCCARINAAITFDSEL